MATREEQVLAVAREIAEMGREGCTWIEVTEEVIQALAEVITRHLEEEL